MLKVENLSFAYTPERPLLKNINMTAKRGEITVLIGPSGTGKTTLLRCLALLDRPSAGRIEIDEQSYVFPFTKDARPAKPWPKLTTVFQQLFLWPHMTLRENILLPLRLNPKNGTTLQPLSPDAQRHLEELVEAFGMSEFINRYPNEASLGQRQRTALARALMLNPSYLLLDEITSALDVEQVAKILNYLKQLRGRDIGIFLITHLLGFARHAADQVIFMDGGEIVEQGPADILRAPQSDRLCQFISVVQAAS